MKTALSVAAAGLFLLPITALCSPTPPQPQQTQPAEPRTNKDVLDMVRAELSPEIVVAKIKSSPSDFDTTPAALAALKAAGAPDAVILAMIQASTQGKPPQAGRELDELSVLYKKLQNSVVTVWSEIGHGAGFIVDEKGLFLTNHHVVGPSELISVQFDPKHKVRAVLLAADREKDVAVLWTDLSAFPGAIAAPIAPAGGKESPAIEGEGVFTIGARFTRARS
jgi:S1-C subfamily serine protease